MTAESAHVCGKCGRTPARFFAYEHITAKVLTRGDSAIYLFMCRDCSRQVGRPMQAATLVTGWWGTKAFVRNLVSHPCSVLVRPQWRVRRGS